LRNFFDQEVILGNCTVLRLAIQFDSKWLVNAWWCMPGEIGFFTRESYCTQDDTGIAVVMGREFAHLSQRTPESECQMDWSLILGSVWCPHNWSKIQHNAGKSIFMQSLVLKWTGECLVSLENTGRNEWFGTYLNCTGYDPRPTFFWEECPCFNSTWGFYLQDLTLEFQKLKIQLKCQYAVL
jgi:hypothetical protein